MRGKKRPQHKPFYANERTKMKKKILGVLIIALVGFGAYWFYSKQALNAEQMNECLKKGDTLVCQELVDSGLPSVEKCKKKDCADLGYVYYKVGEFAQALSYYEKGCGLNDGRACNYLGLLYGEGKGVEKDAYKSFEFAKKSCDLNYAYGCYNVGAYYEMGFGITKNISRASEYYDKTCSMKDGEACFSASKYYYDARNFSKALQMSHKACSLNEPSGCFLAGLMHHNAQGVEQNFAMARKYYEKACEADFAKACYFLGDFYANSKGVKSSNFSATNYTKAKNYFEKACELGEQKACDEHQVYDTIETGLSWISAILDFIFK